MIRADIETVVSPIVGTEKQSEELMHDLLNEFEEFAGVNGNYRVYDIKVYIRETEKYEPHTPKRMGLSYVYDINYPSAAKDCTMRSHSFAATFS